MESKQFIAEIESLGSIRKFLTEASESAGLDKKQTYNLCLAVDEVAANIILYGYEGSGLTGVMDVHVQTSDSELKVTLEDDSPRYDPQQQELPGEQDLEKPLDERPIGGLGLVLAITSVDEFKYEYVNGRNRNIFVVRL